MSVAYGRLTVSHGNCELIGPHGPMSELSMNNDSFLWLKVLEFIGAKVGQVHHLFKTDLDTSKSQNHLLKPCGMKCSNSLKEGQCGIVVLISTILYSVDIAT